MTMPDSTRPARLAHIEFRIDVQNPFQVSDPFGRRMEVRLITLSEGMFQANKSHLSVHPGRTVFLAGVSVRKNGTPGSRNAYAYYPEARAGDIPPQVRDIVETLMPHWLGKCDCPPIR